MTLDNDITCLQDMEHLETGDIVLLQSGKLTSTVIRRLISVRYGIPYKRAFSHIQLIIGPNLTLSAEAGGVKHIKSTAIRPGTRVMVFRINNATGEQKEIVRELAKKYKGKKYSYARYLLDTSNIARFFTVLLSPLMTLAGWFTGNRIFSRLAVGYMGAFVVLTLLNVVWKIYDRKCYDCTEVVSRVLEGAKMWSSFEEPRNEHPNGMKHVLENLCLHGSARLLGDFTV